MVEEFIGSLVMDDRLLHRRRIGRGHRRQRTRGEVGLVLDRLTDRLEDRQQSVGTQHGDLLVVADEGAGAVRRRQRVGPDEAGEIIDAEQAEHGGRDVDLAHHRVELAGSDIAGRPDEERDLILTDLELTLARDGGAVVSHDDEDRVLEPRLGLRGLEESPDGVVRIGHAALAVDQLRVDLTGRPGIRTVIGGRHHEVMEGLTRGVSTVGLFERPRERVLIAGAPGVGEARLLTSAELARQVDDVVAVGLEEVIHVVEEPVSSVKEGRLVALGLQDRTQRREVFTTRPAQNGLTRDRRDGER